MTDYATHFSCTLDVGTRDNAIQALDLYHEVATELAAQDEPAIGFVISVTGEPGSTQLWMRDDIFGAPEHVVRFVRRCAKAFRLTGRWGFQWANTCSRPRPDGYGGGAFVLDLASGRKVASIDTDGWLARKLDPTPSRRGAP